MALTGTIVADRVSELLQDVSRVTWTEPQLIEWCNDAVRALVLVRPDVSAVFKNLQLVAGTRQELTVDGDLRLMSLPRNMGATGSTVGRSITGPVPQEDMDAINPSWHTDTATGYVIQYVHDLATPKVFYVYPQVESGSEFYVEARVSQLPTVITALTETLAVDDIYGPALIEWILYRAWSRDAETSPNWQRGAKHYENFFNILGIKSQIDAAISPESLELAR